MQHRQLKGISTDIPITNNYLCCQCTFTGTPEQSVPSGDQHHLTVLPESLLPFPLPPTNSCDVWE